MQPLKTGDKAYIKVKGRKLRGVIADFLPMPTRGQAGKLAMVPFLRRKKVRWVPRGFLRKLPTPLT